MKAGIVSILLALILVLIPYLPVVAQETGTITITMTGVNEISITVSPTSWSPVGGATVKPNTPYETDSTWCTLTAGGNCNMKTFIVGKDAEWVDNAEYKWTLSNDGTNGDHIYGLWFRISGDTTRGPHSDGYVPITKTEGEFWPYAGGSTSSLAPGDTKQFGLKLLTPSPDLTKDGVGYFSVGDATMETHITISVVAA